MGSHDWRAHLRHMMKIFEMSQLGYTEEEFMAKRYTDIENEFTNAFKTKGLSYRSVLIQYSTENGFDKQDYDMILGSKDYDNETMDLISERLAN